MSSKVVIDVKNLYKKYRTYKNPHDRLKQALFKNRIFYEENEVLKNINFQLYEGETLGIIGINGAGKSTLLQIICGTLSPTSGEVKINGRIAALLELGAGFNPEFTGLENIKLSGKIYGLTDKEIEDKIGKIIEFSGIGDFVFKEVRTYSSGMFVRLAFSVIAHLDPKILVVDEALAVGDFLFQQKCALYMKETLSDVSKILVSHDLASIANLADRVIVLHKGSVAYIGETQKAIAIYQKLARGSLNDINDLISSRGENSEVLNDEKQINKIDEKWLDVHEDVQSGTGRVVIRKFNWMVNNKIQSNLVAKEDILKVEFIFDVKSSIDLPIIGYQVQDRFGAPVFGENTFSSNFNLDRLLDGRYLGRLSFKWPQIAPGEYAMTLGVGNGLDSTAHVVECWAHNIIVLNSIQTDPVHGIFNNEIKKFNIEKLNNDLH